MIAYGITPLDWAYCWNSPWVSHNGSKIANDSAVIEYFKGQGTRGSAGVSGVGLDECNTDNEHFPGEKALAAKGFRQARKTKPEGVIAGWGANDGDEVFASLMVSAVDNWRILLLLTSCPLVTLVLCNRWTAPSTSRW
jgi:hypothetical protein